MGYYPLAGLAHKLIFVGFMVLLLRSLMLWGRGFDPAFNLWILGPKPTHLPLVGDVPLGAIYEFVKDVTASLVIFGALVFLYYRGIKHEARMTLSGEGIAHPRHHHRHDGRRHGLRRRLHRPLAPLDRPDLHPGRGGHLRAHPRAHRAVRRPRHRGGRGLRTSTRTRPARWWRSILDGAGPENLAILATLGFWTHATLVLVFANLLPHSKHFHIITAIPNVFARDITPARPPALHGRLREDRRAGDEGRRGAREGRAPSASPASRTSPGRPSSTSTPAPSAAAAPTTARPTRPARS